MSAALTYKYVGSSGPSLEDVSNLLSDFNDATMAALADSGLSAEEKKALKAKRTAHLEEHPGQRHP